MQANDINDSGVIVGGYVVSDVDRGAFIRLPTGQFQNFQYQLNPRTSAYGINNSGVIVGQVFDGILGQVSHQSSFLRNADGTFIPIAVPGASETQVFGINNSGQTVGMYVNNGVHGFIRDSTGSFALIDVPGAASTQPWDINDLGQISGTTMFNGLNYAFIATPGGSGVTIRGIPEPSALTLLAFATLIAVARRSRGALIRQLPIGVCKIGY